MTSSGCSARTDASPAVQPATACFHCCCHGAACCLTTLSPMPERPECTAVSKCANRDVMPHQNFVVIESEGVHARGAGFVAVWALLMSEYQSFKAAMARLIALSREMRAPAQHGEAGARCSVASFRLSWMRFDAFLLLSPFVPPPSGAHPLALVQHWCCAEDHHHELQNRLDCTAAECHGCTLLFFLTPPCHGYFCRCQDQPMLRF